MAAEGEFPKSPGDVIYASEYNLLAKSAMIVYSGTDYNTSRPTYTSGSDIQSYEFSVISPSNLIAANYIKVEVFADVTTNANAGQWSKVKFKIQTRESGGTYSDSLPYKTISYLENDNTAYIRHSHSVNITYLHSLTAAEKASGVQIKVFSMSENSSADAYTSSSFSNIQTTIYPL